MGRCARLVCGGTPIILLPPLAKRVAQICVLVGTCENRVALSSVPHARRRSEPPKAVLRPHITLSRRASTHWSCAEGTVLLQEQTSSDPSGRITSKRFERKVRHPQDSSFSRDVRDLTSNPGQIASRTNRLRAMGTSGLWDSSDR